MTQRRRERVEETETGFSTKFTENAKGNFAYFSSYPIDPTKR